MSAAPRSLGELALLCGAELRGAGPGTVATGVAPLDHPGPGNVSFYSNPSYRRQLAGSAALAIIVGAADAGLPELRDRPLLVVENPYAAFAKVASAFAPTPPVAPGIDPAARVEAGAEVDPSARVEAFAFVGAGAHVGPRAAVMSGAWVGAGAEIGADTILHPRAVVRERCVVGERCVLHPGVVIGADGFGFAFDPAGDGEGPIHRKIPQVGIARIEDDVEIGANSCVDRATLGETVVGRGTKIDNLVQIGHNVVIGPLCVLAAQVGIAGSTVVGGGVAMGGQVGVAGHLRIGDMARLGAKSGIGQDIPAGATMTGYPTLEHRHWIRAMMAVARLPELLRDMREIRKKLGLPARATAAKDQAKD